MEKDNDIKKELEGISPFLAGVEKKDYSFSVPENYFDEFPNLMMQKVVKEKPSKSFDWRSLFAPRPAFAFGIVLILLTSGIIFYINSINKTSAELDATDIAYLGEAVTDENSVNLHASEEYGAEDYILEYFDPSSKNEEL